MYYRHFILLSKMVTVFFFCFFGTHASENDQVALLICLHTVIRSIQTKSVPIFPHFSYYTL